MITHHVSTSGLGATEFDSERVDRAILAVEGVFAQMERCEFKTEHMFVPKLYFRRLDLPAGSWATGKLHAQDDGLIIASGKMTFHTKNGIWTFEGPCMVTVRANTKPLVYAHTDVVMFSAHANPDDSRDLEVIESRIVIPNSLGCESQEVLP